MSWCRWGSRCDNTWPKRYKCNAECKDCPGSDLYIYEREDEGEPGYLVCCGCRLSADAWDYEASTEEEMNRHLIEHANAGHHVRKSLLEWARTGKEPDPTD